MQSDCTTWLHLLIWTSNPIFDMEVMKWINFLIKTSQFHLMSTVQSVTSIGFNQWLRREVVTTFILTWQVFKSRQKSFIQTNTCSQLCLKTFARYLLWYLNKSPYFGTEITMLSLGKLSLRGLLFALEKREQTSVWFIHLLWQELFIHHWHQLLPETAA